MFFCPTFVFVRILIQSTHIYFRYLYIYYLPSGLFVAVSWVSFVIPPEVVPGRMALLVTLFLVLTNIFNTITNVSPNVEGMNAIASWMIACMFFVFLALLEYAAILYFLLVSINDQEKYKVVRYIYLFISHILNSTWQYFNSVPHDLPFNVKNSIIPYMSHKQFTASPKGLIYWD